jgi:hypothetical protein
MELNNDNSSDWLEQYKSERPNYKKSNIIHYPISNIQYPISTYKCCSNKILQFSYDGCSVQIC